MTTRSSEHLSELERNTNDYLARIRQIDAILERPVMTLIRIGKAGMRDKAKEKDNRLVTNKSVDFPALIAESGEFDQSDTLLTQSLCCVTLQRLWRLRRRFSWLEDNPKVKPKEALKELQEYLGQSYVPSNGKDFESYLELLKSGAFGWLNPLTASQVANVLLDSEVYAHRGMGFLTFFIMLWSLYRRFPDPMRVGARIEPWEPTAYVTAKCLLSLKTLQTIVERRAGLYERVSENLVDLKHYSTDTSYRGRWQFSAELDDLSANLRLLKRYSITKKEFSTCAKTVEDLSEDRHVCGEVCKTNRGASSVGNERAFNCTLDSLQSALAEVGRVSEEVLEEARCVVDGIETEIVACLRSIEVWKEGDAPPQELQQLQARDLRFPKEYEYDPKYWTDVRDAAESSLGLTRQVLKEVQNASDVCKRLAKYPEDVGEGANSGGKLANSRCVEAGNETTQEGLFKAIKKTISELVKSNLRISSHIRGPLTEATAWCRAVVDREIAHASGKNVSDFEPSELVNAIAVTVRWNLMTTESQVSAAVKSALNGAREDGSWKAGQPFYSPDDVQGIWPVTSAAIWTLTSAIGHYPDVREADDALFRYVDWLERRCVTLRRPAKVEPKTGQKGADSPPSDGGSEKLFEYVGWPGERLRHRRKIHLATTAYSINALLEIRDLVEYRLWQLCKERFTVVNVDKSLKQMDPVDLGVTHKERLHTRLARMAREAQFLPEEKQAYYSLVLHGQPGSSKTSIAKSLSNEMWKASSSRWGGGDPRLLRITPADFTRLGEARIDSEARLIFQLIGGIRGATILFDEIDDLLRERVPGSSALRFIDLIVPAMLNRLADLRESCPRQETCFIIATNFIEKIEPALIRKGRIDASLAMVYPDWESRLALIEREFPHDDDHSQCKRLATKTAHWPYLTIKAALADIAERFDRSNGVEPGRFEDAVDTIVVEHESSFSKPGYKARWQKMERFSQELLNEHIQHIFSISEAPDELKNDQFKDVDTGDKIVELLAVTDAKEKLTNMIKLLRSKRQSSN
jgi:hypothetical protein